MSNILIKIENLTKNYYKDKQVVFANNDINCCIYEGEILALLGHNGSGKTTLIRQLIGVLSSDKGAIKFNKPNLKIGYMGQQRSSILWHLTCFEAIMILASLKGFSYNKAKNEADYWLEFFDLKKYKNTIITNLSGGEHQIIDLIIALIGKPDILILDEPTTQIDLKKRQLIYSMIYRLNKEKQITILLVTHNLAEAEEIANRFIILGGGKILKDGSISYLRELVDDNNLYIEINEQDFKKIDIEVYKALENITIIKKIDNKYIISIPSDNISRCIEILNQSSFFSIFENIKLSKTSLENIYIKLNGQ